MEGVKEEIRRIIEEGDGSTIEMKKVRKMVHEKYSSLGLSKEDIKAITIEVNNAIGEEEEEEEEVVIKRKRKRKGDGDGDGGRKRKRRKKEDSFVKLDEDGAKRVTVSMYKKRKQVCIRRYYFDKNGEAKPTKSGLNLNMDEWEVLKNSIEIIDEFVDEL